LLIAICEPDPSDDVLATLFLVVLVLVYFGLLALAIARSRSGERVRVGVTWLLSASGASILAWRLAEAGSAAETVVIATIALALLVSFAAASLRESERAWPCFVAGSIGGVTPVAFLAALVAWILATGCLD